MQIDMYESAQIDEVVALIEAVQDGLEIEDPDILHMLLQQVLEILLEV